MTTTIANPKQTWSEHDGVRLGWPIVILGFLVLVGVVAGLWRMLNGLGATTALTDRVPWGIWIGFDFTLIALSGAAFTMAGLVYILRQEQYRPALRTAVLTGLLGYTAVLVLLVLDLGRPDRFYHFLIFWNIHSPLFEICWCILLYTTVLVIEFSPQLLERFNQGPLAHRVHSVIVPVAIAAVTLSSLHQSTLGTLYLNMPYRLHSLWYTPTLPLLFFVSAVMTGLSVAGLAYLLASRIHQRHADARVVAGLAKGAAGAGALYLVLKMGDLLWRAKISELLSFDPRSWRMWLELAPVIGGVILLALPRVRRNGVALATGLALLPLGTFMNRMNATLYGQVAPAGATYSPSLTEWLTTIGVLAAALLAWLLAVRYMPVFEEHP